MTCAIIKLRIMYKLFTKRFEANNYIVRPPAFELLRRIYQREIMTIVEYFQSRVFAVKSNHLLCRVINTAYVSSDIELTRFIEIINSRSPYVAKHFNFTSSISYGKIHEGVFYGEGSKELILYDEEYFNPYYEALNWKQIRAIEVLEHNISNMGLILPNGKVNNTESGLVVIKINLPLLLLQYRFFELEQRNRMSTEIETNYGVTHFVYKYVLPNMLYSHIELCILNRLMNLFYGAPMGNALVKYPFPIIKYDNKLDNVLKDVLKHIKDTGMPYYSTLRNIPNVFNADSQESLQMPDMAKTRQVWWALVLTRLRVMKFLVDCGGKRGVAGNGTYIARMKIEFKRLLDEDTYRSILDKDMHFDIIETMKELKNL